MYITCPDCGANITGTGRCAVCWLYRAAKAEEEHGSFPTIGRSPKQPMTDTRITCSKITCDVPTEGTGRIYSRPVLDGIVEQSNAMAAKGKCFVVLGLPEYGGRIRLADVAGSAFNFEVSEGQIACTLRLLPTPKGELARKLLEQGLGLTTAPLLHAFVGEDGRVLKEGLLLSGWYVEAETP